MTVKYPDGSDHQIARLLQIGVVLEDVIEARANKHIETSVTHDPELQMVLSEAVEQTHTPTSSRNSNRGTRTRYG